MVTLPMTFSNPNYLNAPHFLHFVSPSAFHIFLMSGDGDFKFGTQLDRNKTSLDMTNHGHSHMTSLNFGK